MLLTHRHVTFELQCLTRMGRGHIPWVDLSPRCPMGMWREGAPSHLSKHECGVGRVTSVKP